MLSEHPRIVVVGTSASGKTSFSRSLAQALGRPHVELDALHWGPGWTARPDFAELVAAAVNVDSWVVDGNYRTVRDRIWERATAIVWLNYPFRVVFYRALARTIRRIISRETLYAGNQESWRGAFLARDGIPWWVIGTYRKRRREYTALLRGPHVRHLAVFELRSHAEAMALLAGEGLRRGCGERTRLT